jgi:hypothetical protein
VARLEVQDNFTRMLVAGSDPRYDLSTIVGNHLCGFVLMCYQRILRIALAQARDFGLLLMPEVEFVKFVAVVLRQRDSISDRHLSLDTIPKIAAVVEVFEGRG